MAEVGDTEERDPMAESEKGRQRMLGITEASQFLGVNPKTLRKWADAGIVRAARLPGRGDRRFTMGELQRVRREVLGLED